MTVGCGRGDFWRFRLRLEDAAGDAVLGLLESSSCVCVTNNAVAR